MSITQKALTSGRHECSIDGCTNRTNKRNDGCAICKQKAARKRSHQKQIEKRKEQARKKVVASIELEKDLINYNRYPIKSKKKRGKAYRDAAEEMIAEKGNFCHGCGTTNEKLTTSHRVPSKELEGKGLVNTVENLDLLCIPCHQAVENFDLEYLQNKQLAEQIEEYTAMIAPKYYRRKVNQRFRNENLKRK